MTTVKLVGGWETTKRSISLLEHCLEKVQFLEEEGLLREEEMELTRITRELEGAISRIVEDLFYDAQCTDLSVGQDYRYIAESLEKYHDNFGG